MPRKQFIMDKQNLVSLWHLKSKETTGLYITYSPDHRTISSFRQWHRMLWYLQSMQGFYSSKIPVNRWNSVRHLATKLQQTNCILCGYTTNSRDHRRLSKLLKHALLQILQWNKGADTDTNHFKIHFCIYITVNIHTYVLLLIRLSSPPTQASILFHL